MLNPPFRKTDSGVRPMFLQYATIVSASSIACSTSRPLKGPRFEFGTGSERFFPSALTLATGCGAVVGDASSPSDPSESMKASAQAACSSLDDVGFVQTHLLNHPNRQSLLKESW